MKTFFFISFMLLLSISIYAGDDPKITGISKIGVSASANISATIMEPVTTDWLQEKIESPKDESTVKSYSIITICEQTRDGQNFEVTVLNCE